MENVLMKRLSPKQKKIAKKAPPRNKITKADFKVLRQSKKSKRRQIDARTLWNEKKEW